MIVLLERYGISIVEELLGRVLATWVVLYRILLQCFSTIIELKIQESQGALLLRRLEGREDYV